MATVESLFNKWGNAGSDLAKTRFVRTFTKSWHQNMLAKTFLHTSELRNGGTGVDLLMRNEDPPYRKHLGLQINKEPLERKMPHRILLGSIKWWAGRSLWLISNKTPHYSIQLEIYRYSMLLAGRWKQTTYGCYSRSNELVQWSRCEDLGYYRRRTAA
jgi:hypothetical protein